MEETKRRQDGALSSLGELVSKLPKDIGSIATLMGENKAEYNGRMKARYRQQQTTGKSSTQFEGTCIASVVVLLTLTHPTTTIFLMSLSSSSTSSLCPGINHFWLEIIISYNFRI